MKNVFFLCFLLNFDQVNGMSVRTESLHPKEGEKNTELHAIQLEPQDDPRNSKDSPQKTIFSNSGKSLFKESSDLPVVIKRDSMVGPQSIDLEKRNSRFGAPLGTGVDFGGNNPLLQTFHPHTSSLFESQVQNITFLEKFKKHLNVFQRLTNDLFKDVFGVAKGLKNQDPNVMANHLSDLVFKDILGLLTRAFLLGKDCGSALIDLRKDATKITENLNKFGLKMQKGQEKVYKKVLVSLGTRFIPSDPTGASPPLEDPLMECNEAVKEVKDFFEDSRIKITKLIQEKNPENVSIIAENILKGFLSREMISILQKRKEEMDHFYTKIPTPKEKNTSCCFRRKKKSVKDSKDSSSLEPMNRPSDDHYFDLENEMKRIAEARLQLLTPMKEAIVDLEKNLNGALIKGGEKVQSIGDHLESTITHNVFKIQEDLLNEIKKRTEKQTRGILAELCACFYSTRKNLATVQKIEKEMQNIVQNAEKTTVNQRKSLVNNPENFNEPMAAPEENRKQSLESKAENIQSAEKTI